MSAPPICATGLKGVSSSEEGSYYLDDPDYGVNGFYGMRGQAAAWREALGPNQILVKAAGNSGTDYSAGANQMATATGDDGTLLLNGQMLIVGNWDAAAGRITGNRAGMSAPPGGMAPA